MCVYRCLVMRKCLHFRSASPSKTPLTMPKQYSREIIQLYQAIVNWARHTYPEITAGKTDWEVVQFVAHLSI